jgi:hypothetical protein
LFSALSLNAETLYVSQSGGTASCGADGNQSTQSASFFNSASNWGAGTGKISPGDTVNLCGSFTCGVGATLLTVQGSGSSGNPITVRWESNATMTSLACGNFINTGGKSWMVFDGNGTNPSMTNTDNGSTLGHKVDSGGFSANPCDNCEFKNLTITNIYRHNSTSDTTAPNSGAISINGSNWSVHDNSFDQMYAPIDSAYQDGNTNIQIYKNTFDHFNWGVHIGNNAPTALSNVFLHDNHLKNMNNWDTVTDSYHHDGLFVVQNDPGAHITNVFFYNNLADGRMSDCSPNTCATAWLFYNTGLNGIYVFNNILIGDGSSFLLEGGWAGDKNFYFYHNYLDCNPSGSGPGLNYSNVSGWVFQNNAVQNCGNPFQDLKNITNKTSDYNVFKNYASGEPHSLNVSDLKVDPMGVPQAGSPLIHNDSSAFPNLASSCTGGLSALCTDVAHAKRPQSGQFNWDSGAYVYGQDSGGEPEPPTGLNAEVK